MPVVINFEAVALAIAVALISYFFADIAELVSELNNWLGFLQPGGGTGNPGMLRFSRAQRLTTR